jgi:hypothetical protein
MAKHGDRLHASTSWFKISAPHSSINKIWAQCYDGAANMAGKYSGVQARILQLNPEASYVHWKAHSLNLALIHSSKDVPIITLCSNFVDIQSKICEESYYDITNCCSLYRLGMSKAYKFLSYYNGQVLSDHLEFSANTRVKYTSPDIQNELIELCGAEILNQLVDACKRSPCLPLLQMNAQKASKVQVVPSTVIFSTKADTKIS